MTPEKFLKEEKGVIAAEYVVFMAAIGILLAVGVFALTGAIRDLLTAWAGYFGAS
jgi:Flp pilus assembly pilin Flp